MMPALNPALDVGGIAETYRRNGRVHIPDVLTGDSATRLHRCLEQETPFALLTGSGQAQVWPASILTPQKEAELMTAAFSQARENFHYLYDAHNMSEDGIAYPDPAHYLAAVTQFLNSAPLLDFARIVTGVPAIAFAFRPRRRATARDISSTSMTMATARA